MSLKKPKYMTKFAIFKRINRGKIGHFCSYKPGDCEYFDKKEIHHTCMKITISCYLGNKEVCTTLYGLCSYLNRSKSSYLYAPQKTIHSSKRN